MPLYHPLCLQKDGLQKLQPWIPVVEDLAPEVLILVCDRVCEYGQFFLLCMWLAENTVLHTSCGGYNF